MPEEKQQLLSNESSSETYQLQVDASEQLITITGAGNAGVFYGVQTLLSLVDYQGSVPQVSIKDSPRFAYRGLMVDVVRNFQPKHEILKLLDVMAMYKMNKFHFHLSDNEGWRLEIPGIEELTSVSKSSLSILSNCLFLCRICFYFVFTFSKQTQVVIIIINLYLTRKSS